ncbi:MAG: hypothetical protein FWF84_00100, partial [Kiritimatiellaeota bacterium]|nr:hypothetical protein [Kiritimatiellota bacterium]
MRKLLVVMISTTALCLYCAAQEEGTGMAAGASSVEEYCRAFVEEAEARLRSCGSPEERFNMAEKYYDRLNTESARFFDSKPDEYPKILGECVKAGAALRKYLIEASCKMLEEKFDDPETVNYVMKALSLWDGRDFASSSHREALGWARKVIGEKRKGYGKYWAEMYLEVKGDARDLDVLPSGILGARVAGTNVLDYDSVVSPSVCWCNCIPSVTNTGPQGFYVNEILRQCWESLEVGMDFLGNPRRDLSKIPPELLTLVVWFDKKGNPVCNVDLAKYGLTMPVIEPKPTSPGFNWVDYTV